MRALHDAPNPDSWRRIMKHIEGILFAEDYPQSKTGDLNEYNLEFQLRKLISGLLGLASIPDKWIKVCVFDEDCYDGNQNVHEGKSDDWHGTGYYIDGVLQKIPFPACLPLNLFEGRKEGDTLSFTYGEIEVTVTLRQLACRFGNKIRFEDILSKMADSYEEDDVSGEGLTCNSRTNDIPTAAKVVLGILGGLAILACGIGIGKKIS
jgi:hypothetical protein